MLDHHFAVADHFVHVHGRAIVAAAHHHRRRVLAAAHHGPGFFQQRTEVVEWHRTARQFQRAGVVGLGQQLRAQLLHVVDHARGDRVHALAHTHQQHLRDGGGQRQVDGEARAHIRRGLQRDAATQRHRLGAHHVHANAAAGQFRHLLGGGEAGREDHLGQPRLAGFLVGCQQLALQRAGADAFEVQAGAVIDEVKYDLVAFLLHF